jgi:hypothetical protein
MSTDFHIVNAQRRSLKLVLASVLWASAMMTSAIFNLFLLERASDKNTILLVLFFGLGALLAFPLTVTVMRWIPTSWRYGQRFALSFLTLMLLTIGFSAFIFALQFRIYYAQWHDDEYSRRFMFETVFTILSAVYQFLVLALRLYLPFGLLALLGASWGFATKRI